MKLYILPFDHRSSFVKDVLGAEKPSKEQKKEIENLKQIIFTGLEYSLKERKDKKSFAVLVDEEYGAKVISAAKRKNIKICLPIEKSGESILKLEYGKNYEKHILKIAPDFVKILIRYNPENINDNKKQLKTLENISAFCKKNKQQTILELLVPPTKNDLSAYKDKSEYDKKIRASKTALAIKEIKNVFKPSIWKLEGFDENGWKKVIKETKKDKIIVLGRGEDDKKVKQWLKSASRFDSIIGFAIGRTIFMDPIKKYHSKQITAQKASLLISKKFLSFISLWEKEKL